MASFEDFFPMFAELEFAEQSKPVLQLRLESEGWEFFSNETVTDGNYNRIMYPFCSVSESDLRKMNAGRFPDKEVLITKGYNLNGDYVPYLRAIYLRTVPEYQRN